MKSATAILALVAASAAGSAVAADYNANHFFAERHSMVRGPYVEFAKKVSEATDGEVNFTVFSGGSLLPPAASLQGVRDGVAQVTYHAGTYTPAELPVANLIGNAAFYNTDPLVMAFASTEFGLTNEAALEEWRNNGVVFGGGYSTSEYVMMCNTPVKSFEDIQGKRLRMAGGAWTRFAEFVGAVPVSIPSSEMYTGLDTGSLDCAVAAADALDSFSLSDVVTSMNTLAIGNYYAGFEWGYNRAFWQSLSPENREVLFDQMAYYLAQHRVEFDADVEKAVTAAKSNGMQVYKPDQALKDALADFVEADEAVLIENAEKRGVENAEAVLEDYKKLVDRWDVLLAEVDRTDVDALAELARVEIYDQLDPASYGTE
ncbi:C4-dicarboxylate TRAP transporter substrate-binding protein [Tranquillimonas alkanivorans]|uniref:TRAP-type C4-dicarboxylate transport system, substrate-binding protein n=1 Tax=Tranquillimonas alkanivorans TaxID=441119 RepID=A0A1I5T5L0_9RHOB|nr:C4-dicarboxylate TRAP transporter substrate-binding protein [Tranquillimonas alkanivorans]SFP78285.1 TRAP-type C4-dicarboxylate transport system, substrate-binding protein [Tranquillimonas alkanivorans]